MTTSHNGNDYERLKQELRTLKRRGAPWYFESALHQRLHGGGRRGPRRRPISIFPVLAVAFVTLCILALAAYVVLIRTNIAFPVQHETGPAAVDSLPRVPSGETAHPLPSKPSSPVKPAPRVAPREPEQVTAPAADTNHAVPQAIQRDHRDSAAARKDTASALRDTASRAPDTSASRPRPGRPD